MSPARIARLARGFGGLVPRLLVVGLGLLSVALAVAQVGTGMGSSSLGKSSANGTPTASADIPSTVQGQVINASTGAPVPRALVRLNNRAVLTDHDGKFRFDQNTEAAANVLVTKPGYAASTEVQEAGNVFLQGAQLGVPLELRLYPEALLTGTVLAPDGTPIPRISVSAMRSFFDDTGHRWVPVGQEQTDSHGNFRLPVPAGDYRVETRYTPMDRTTGEAVLPVSAPGGNSSSTSDSAIHLHSGEEQHFELRPAVTPTHTVTIMTPSSGGRDFVRISARSSTGSTLQVNPMGGGGGETRVQLPQGTYTLMARKNNPDNPEEAETTVTVPDHDISGVVLQFAPIPSIPVEEITDSSATSDNGNPPTVQQLGLMLQGEQMDPDRGDSAVRSVTRKDQSVVFTAAPGTYRLQGRSTGAWYIKSATYGDSDLLKDDLVVVPGASGTPIRVVVSNVTGSLQGTVNLNGSPAACWVYLIPNSPNVQSVISLRSSTTGSYTSPHLPPGSYQVVAFERRHSANYRDPASLAPFSSHVHSVTVNAGDKPTLNLDAVPVAEVTP